MLSAATASGGYLARRCVSIASLMFIDVAALVIAVALLGHLRSVWPSLPTWPPALVAAASLALVTIFALQHLYGLREARRLKRRRLRAALWFLAATLVLASIARMTQPEFATVAALLAVVMLTAGREAFDFGLRVVFGLDTESRRTIVVGSDRACARFVAEGRLARREPVRILGTVQEAPPSPHAAPSPLPHLGALSDIEAVVELWRPDELVVVDRTAELHHLADLADLCRRRHLTLKLADLEMRFSSSGVSLIPGVGEDLFVAAPATPSGLAWVAKRCADVLAAATLLVLLSPALAVVALLVKLTSRGPVLYRSERVGLGERHFRCLKFRTMYADADQRQAALEDLNEADGAMFKIRLDPRTTKIGRWLRASSFDELPQLINVLRGEMSLVGPRPLPLRDNELLGSWHKQRHLVLPGLTGLWQVSGRSDISFEDMIRLDLDYVDSWSLWLDLSIAWRTLRAVMGERGAY